MAGTFLIGIDPGVSGAIAVMKDDATRIIDIHDMPFITENGKRRVCPTGVGTILGIYRHDCIAVLEHVQGVQQSGATSAFNFGRGFGIIEGTLGALRVMRVLVRPQAWTKALGVGSDKNAHRAAAMRLWPDSAELFKRAKDDGRADAALLCHWYARHGGQA
jgi:hypothetical protein